MGTQNDSKHPLRIFANLQVDDFLAGTEISFPSLEEHQSLTHLIDRIESKRLGSAGHLNRAKLAIERFRQSVLAAVYRQASQWNDEITLSPLKHLLREPLKNGYSARPVKHETPFRVLTLTATTSGWFDARHFKYTDEEFASASTYWLEPGDVLIQRGNTAEYVGVPAIYEGASHQFLYPDLMIRARIQLGIIPRFVWYMLLAPQARSYLRSRASGSAGSMPKINQKVLNEVPLPLPPHDLQMEIVARIDRAIDLADACKQKLDAASLRLSRTSQSILAKTFRGELAANEPTS